MPPDIPSVSRRRPPRKGENGKTWYSAPPKRTPFNGTPEQLLRQEQAYGLYIRGATVTDIAKALKVSRETALTDINFERERIGSERENLDRQAILDMRIASIDAAKRVVHTIASDPSAERRDRVAAAKAVGDLEVKAATLARLDEAKKVSVSGDIGVGIAGGDAGAIGAGLAIGLLASLGALRRETATLGHGGGEPRDVRATVLPDGPGPAEGGSVSLPP